MTDASGSAIWTYDPRGRMLSEAKTLTGASTYTTSWTYNSADLPVTMTYPDGEIVTTAYNDRMLLNSVTGTSTYVTSTTYDVAGRMTNRTLEKNIKPNFTYYGWTETATVDGTQVGQGGRLKNITVGTLQNLSYVYDAVGNIRTIQNSLVPETQSYGYDTLDRLISATVTGGSGYTETYAYHATSGNLTTKGTLTLGYTDTGHVHAVTSAGGNIYSYDANGNQTARTIGADVYNLKYDAENRLVEVKKNSAVIATFTYDGDGQRVKSVMGSDTILFIGPQGHYEIKNPGAGQQVTKYYFAGASRVAMRKYTIPVSMVVEYFLGDHLGSTSITTDTSGAKVSEMRYKAWGEVRYSWTSGVATTPPYTLPDYTFTGQYSNVDDFGLMFYNARWYDSVIGRFTSADAIIPEQTQGTQAWDRYAYGNNSPILYDDPSGHCAGLIKCVISVVKAAVFLASRAAENGRLTNDDFEAAANYAAPAVASGSKESVSGFVSEFVTGVASVSLVTTADGQSQAFVEKGIGASLPGVGVSVTHGQVHGLDIADPQTGDVEYDPLRYAGGATQGNVSIPLPFCEYACGPYLEGYISDKGGDVWGIDIGIEGGATPTILGAAHTNAEPRDTITIIEPISVEPLNKIGADRLTGPWLLGCRLVSMCGAE